MGDADRLLAELRRVKSAGKDGLTIPDNPSLAWARSLGLVRCEVEDAPETSGDQPSHRPILVKARLTSVGRQWLARKGREAA